MDTGQHLGVISYFGNHHSSFRVYDVNHHLLKHGARNVEWASLVWLVIPAQAGAGMALAKIISRFVKQLRGNSMEIAQYIAQVQSHLIRQLLARCAVLYL